MRSALRYVAAVVACTLGLAAPAAADTQPNQFKTRCTVSGTGAFDPIKAFGVEPFGHEHVFFGAVPSPFSTGFNLKAAGRGPDGTGLHTSCEDKEDTALYWFPKAYFNGVEIPPAFITVYYPRIIGLTKSDGTPLNKSTIFPTDFRFIAGNHAAEGPQKNSVARWQCGNSTHIGGLPGDCTAATAKGLTAHVFFPGCWSGKTRDGIMDDVVYMATVNGTKKCPAGYDIQVPRLQMGVHYPDQHAPDCRISNVPGCGTYTLSSGSAYGLHADFLNGWQVGPRPGTLDTLLKQCVNVPDNTAPCGIIATDPRGDIFDPDQLL